MISCDKTPLITSENLVGNWRTESVSFNGVNSSELTTWLNNANFMGISSGGSYYRNYTTGTWSVDEDKFTLHPIPELGIQPWTYTIIDYSETSLTLSIELTEGEYCCDFEEFESDEILSITEKYVRQ